MPATTDPQGLNDDRRHVRRIALAIAFVAFFVHLGLGAGGVGSFEALNYDDPAVLSLARDTSVKDIVSQPLWYAYKPVYFLSLKIDTLFGSEAAGAAHVHNLLLHALAAALLFLVLRAVTRNTWLAAAAGLVFAVHPIHVESVAWISSRKDVLSLVFVLLAHLAYRRARAEGKGRLLAPLFLLLGGLTKGTVWVWSGVLVLDELVEALRARGEGRSVPWGRAFLRVLPCLLIGLGGVALDAVMATRHGPGAVDHGVSTLALAAAMAGVHVRYLFHLVVPASLALDYGVSPDGSWATGLPWVGLLTLLFAVALFVLSWRRRSTLGLFASGIWLIGLLPVNNLWPRTTVLMADRYLYIPAIGLYLLLLGLLSRWRAGRNLALGVGILVLAVLSARRTAVFKTSESVWADAIASAPSSALAYFQAGQAAAANEQWEDAEAHALQAIRLEPRPEILVKARLLRAGALLGRFATEGGRLDAGDVRALRDEAVAARDLALALGTMPGVRQDAREIQAEALVMWGQTLELLREPAAAVDAYAHAVRLWPKNGTAHYNLATLLVGTGSAEALITAERHLREARRLSGDFLDADLQLANVLALQGRLTDALGVLGRAEAKHGRSADLLFGLAQVHLAGRQDVPKAEALLVELRRKAPDHPKATRLLSDIHMAYGRTLMAEGRAQRDADTLERALERFSAAATAAPQRADAEVGAGDVLFWLQRFDEARQRYEQALERSAGERWIQRLIARAAFLESAWLEHHATGAADLDRSARLVADVLASDVKRVDLGLLSIEGELPLYRAVAERYAAGGDDAEQASQVLRALALAVTGDESSAERRINAVLKVLGPTSAARDVLDGTLTLRAALRDRSGLFDDARRDYELLADRRPSDPLPRLRLLELKMRGAAAELSIAQGHAEDQARLQAALDARDRVSSDVLALAGAFPDDLAIGLTAAEAEMNQQNWVGALRRLNELVERHPSNPAVHRGHAMIHLRQYIHDRNRLTLDAALRSIDKALLLDPREVSTYFDAAQVAQAAGDLRSSVRHLRKALSFELVRDGAAARRLADMLIALGHQALEGGDTQRALELAQQAQRVRTGDPGPWILRGNLYLAGKRWQEAFDAFRKAKDLEPASLPANRGLATLHRQRAKFLFVERKGIRTPPHPSQSKEQWAGLDEEGRRDAMLAWQERLAQVELRREALRLREIANYEASLELDPSAEDAEETRAWLDRLREEDPDAQRRAYVRADAAFEGAMEELNEGKTRLAFESLLQAVEAYPKHVRANLLLAATVYDLMRLGTPEDDAARAAEMDRLKQAFQSLHTLDTLDHDQRLYERHRLRGLLNDLLFRRSGREPVREAALRAYRRYLGAAEVAASAADAENVDTVRARLASLERVAKDD